MKKLLRGRLAAAVFALMTILTLGFSSPVVSMAYTPADATVTANSAKVRSDTTTTSSVVGSLTKGNTVQILDEKTDSSGQVWYKVNVTGGTGYVRGDLVSKSATATTGTATATAAASTTTAAATSTATRYTKRGYQII